MKVSEQIEIVLNQLMETADKEKNLKGVNIDNAFGEVEINGTEFQIVISLVSDKKLWCKHNEVRFSEVVKMHPEGQLKK
jgi:hypothetical protein